MRLVLMVVVAAVVAVEAPGSPEVVQVLERALVPVFDTRRPSGPGWRTVRRPAGNVASDSPQLKVSTSV